MEYIQTVLFQVTAASLEGAAAAGGLMPELDEHRGFLKQQEGFEDMRVTRSINPEGNVLVMVETRWSNDESLVRYETNEPNVAGIIRKHQEIIVADSLQVLDMEGLRTESSWAPAEEAVETQERLALPILIPLGVLAFSLLVIYGLSRIYLEIAGTGATILAAAIAGVVLLAAFYFANNPKAPGWQIGGAMAVAALALFGGAIWAVLEEDEAEGGGHEPAPTAENGEDPVPGSAEMARHLQVYAYEARSCFDKDIAARQAILRGDRLSARKFATDLRAKGYFEPGFVRFCEIYDLCFN